MCALHQHYQVNYYDFHILSHDFVNAPQTYKWTLPNVFFKKNLTKWTTGKIEMLFCVWLGSHSTVIKQLFKTITFVAAFNNVGVFAAWFREGFPKKNKKKHWNQEGFPSLFHIVSGKQTRSLRCFPNIGLVSQPRPEQKLLNYASLMQ